VGAAFLAACGSLSGGLETAGGTGAYYGGGGAGVGGGGDYEPPIAPDPLQAPPDAGADAAPSCEGLDTSKPVVLYLSADDSNSMGSPVQARELLQGGAAPYLIRTYEFLNYYRVHYPAAPAGTLSLFAEAEPGADQGTIDLQLGIRSFDAVKPRRPMTVTFVLDTSGSMEGHGIERERAAMKAIAGSLAKGDVVNMVTWNTQNSVVLTAHEVAGPNDQALIAAAEALVADGGTDLSNGLIKGYELANASYGADRLNRVVLMSDGGANVGVTDADLIGLNSEDGDKEGIYLLGVGTGPGESYDDLLMNTVTDRGRGAYVYLDEPGEAERMFGDRFDETMEVAARGVQVELTLPWYFKIDKFYGEEYSTDPAEVQPQHLAPSDAIVLNQVLKACDPSVVEPGDAVKVRVTWQVPLTYEKKEIALDTTVSALLAADKPTLAKGKAIIAYAEALKTGEPDALHAASQRIEAANASGADPELSEIAKLIKLHPAF